MLTIREVSWTSQELWREFKEAREVFRSDMKKIVVLNDNPTMLVQIFTQSCRPKTTGCYLLIPAGAEYSTGEVSSRPLPRWCRIIWFLQGRYQTIQTRERPQ